MKFSIDYHLDVGDESIESASVAADITKYNEALKDIGALTADLKFTFGETERMGDFSDPVVRLAGLWMRKVAWVIGGDTETVALRNSEQCFAFVRTGNGVEVSFYDGDESEIENYVIDPVTVSLGAYVQASFSFAEHVMGLVSAVDGSLLQSDEDCADLVASLGEAKTAWHDYEIHRR